MEKLKRGMKIWLNRETKDLKKINFNILVKSFGEEFKLPINDARMYVMQWDHSRNSR